MKTKQLLALLCVVTLSISVMCSCGKKSENNSTTTTKKSTSTTKEDISSDDSKEKIPLAIDKYKQKLVVKDDTGNLSVKNYDFKKAYESTTTAASSSSNGSAVAPANNPRSSGYNVVYSKVDRPKGISYKETQPTQHTHNYVNGVCSCGKADKSNPNEALSTLLKKHTQKVPNTNCYSYMTVTENMVYSVSYDENDNDNFLFAAERKDDKYLRGVYLFFPDENGDFGIMYEKDGNMYYCVLSAKDFTSKTKMEFYDEKENHIDNVEIQSFAQNSTRILMATFNDFLNQTQCGLTLKDFGFENYDL